MHAKVVCKILRGGYSHTRRGYTLYCRIVCKVYEGDRPVYGAGGAEIVYEEVGFFKRYAYGGKNDGEAFVRAKHPGLTRYLRRKLRMRKAGA